MTSLNTYLSGFPHLMVQNSSMSWTFVAMDFPFILVDGSEILHQLRYIEPIEPKDVYIYHITTGAGSLPSTVSYLISIGNSKGFANFATAPDRFGIHRINHSNLLATISIDTRNKYGINGLNIDVLRMVQKSGEPRKKPSYFPL